jgi:hypothetical protein
MIKRTILLVVLMALTTVGGWAQPTQNVNTLPACQMFFSFAAVSATGSYDNRTNGCDYWVISYSSFTFAGPLSLAVESAANAAGSVPGVWGNFAGTIVSGINPNTSIVGAETQMSGYYPWIRVNLTATGAGAGLVVGTLYGWRTGPPSTVAVPGLVNTNLSQYGGVAVGPTNAIYTQGPCTLSAPIAVAAAGATQIVGLVAAQSIRVCHISLSMQAPVDMGLIRGTGANCAVGPANVTGTYSTVLALGLDFSSPLVVTAANALCINLGAAVTGGGVIRYAQY